jgi:hypothetical protein
MPLRAKRVLIGDDYISRPDRRAGRLIKAKGGLIALKVHLTGGSQAAQGARVSRCSSLDRNLLRDIHEDHEIPAIR